MLAITVPRLIHIAFRVYLYQNVVTAFRDLGVMFYVKLKFNVYSNKIVVKSIARSNLIINCFIVSRDPKSHFLAFATYVRPILEYALCVCGLLALLLILKMLNRSTATSPRG